MDIGRDVPSIERGVVCIVDRENVRLAAVISSHFAAPGRYFALFGFPGIAYGNGDDDFDRDEYTARIIGIEAAAVINNALARLGGSDVLILAGLSEVQKSYIKLHGRRATITVSTLDDVPQALATAGLGRRAALRYNPRSLLNGLYAAAMSDRCLVLDDTAPEVSAPPLQAAGIIVVEEVADHVASVAAANYAVSVKANLRVVPPLGHRENRRILRSIEKWKHDGELSGREEVKKAVSARIAGVDFSSFAYATFFTEGLPYSLVIENVVPCSYVHLTNRADLFVCNAIVFEGLDRLASAVVFSLEQFSTTSEAGSLVASLERHGYFVRAYLGKAATFRNLDHVIQHFPYDLLHIASHGGEIDGYNVKHRFTDRDGHEHMVEYDEVVGISRTGDSDLFEVQSKAIFRRFDGLDWDSVERHESGIPSYVYEDMRKRVFSRDGRGQGATRTPKSKITSSCVIKCVDGIHQGMFQSVASLRSPVIFNNACWSWSDISSFFLSGGARAYIGTLWAVPDDAAVTAAEVFYRNAKGSTLIVALHRALREIAGTSAEDIYVLWGLHFSTLGRGRSIAESRRAVLAEMLRSLKMWSSHVKVVRSAESRERALKVIEELRRDIDRTFSQAEIHDVERATAQRDFPRGKRSMVDSGPDVIALEPLIAEKGEE